MTTQKPNTRLDKIIEGIDRAGMLIAGMLFSLNVLNIVVAVFSRYVLRSSFIWTAELSQVIMVWMVLIAATPALTRGEHMQINILLKYFPPVVNRVLTLLRHFLILGITLFMTIWGFTYANSLWKIVTLGLRIPKSYPLFAVPLGMGLFFITYLLLRIARKPEVHSFKEGV